MMIDDGNVHLTYSRPTDEFDSTFLGSNRWHRKKAGKGGIKATTGNSTSNTQQVDRIKRLIRARTGLTR